MREECLCCCSIADCCVMMVHFDMGRDTIKYLSHVLGMHGLSSSTWRSCGVKMEAEFAVARAFGDNLCFCSSVPV